VRQFTFYRHGVTMANVSTHERRPGKRGKVSGWSSGAARRNVAFLRSVDERELIGVGLALTLTVRTCPPTPEAWAGALRAWIERQSRAGMIRLHWVMEFQRRGVPHLHCAIWYDEARLLRLTEPVEFDERHADIIGRSTLQLTGENDLLAAVPALADWVEVTRDFETGPKGQHARTIEGAIGWFQYLAKHCGRGRSHYQRQQESMPKAWESSPRVWGKRGEWVIEESVSGELTQRQWFRLRRLIRKQRVAQARRRIPEGWHEFPHGLLSRDHYRAASFAGGPPLRVRLRQLTQARAMLRCPDRELSEVRGVSEWVTQAQQAELMRAVSG